MKEAPEVLHTLRVRALLAEALVHLRPGGALRGVRADLPCPACGRLVRSIQNGALGTSIRFKCRDRAALVPPVGCGYELHVRRDS